ncbi:MAG TPA: hypothetical protein DDW30_05520 [Clostridiales bacterium]|nr:hypothetical protein [Clostridiales bacterium]
MKKVSLILMLALLLTLALPFLPVGALESDYAADTVAVIGEKEYTSLQDAFDAVGSGETIRLVKDVTDSKKTFTYSGTTLVKGEAVPRAKVTLDGNGHTISYSGGTSDTNFALVFDSNAIIEVKNLTVLSIRSAVKITDGAQVFLKDCNLCAANTNYKSPVHDLEANKDFKGLIIRIENDFRSYVEIDGGNYYGAQSTGVDIRYGSIVIKSGNFRVWNTEVLLQVGDSTSEEGADKVRASGTILGGTFEASDYTAKFGKLIRAYKSATVTIWDGEFIQRSEGPKSGSAVITGATSSSFGYVYVHGGNFYQLSSQPAAKLIGNNDLTGKGTIPAAKDKVFVFVTGGTFYSRTVEGRNKDDMTREDGILRYDDSVAKIEASTAEYKGISVDKYTVTYQYSEATPCPGAVAKITESDGKVYYAPTLWEALNPFARDGATVTLLADVTTDHTLYLGNRYFSLKLDGNGKTVTSTATDAVNVQTGSVTVENLTLTNTNGMAFRMGYQIAAEEIVSGASYIASLTLKNVTVTAKTLIGTSDKELFSGEATLKDVKLNGTDEADGIRKLPMSNPPTPSDTGTTGSDTSNQEPPVTPEVTTGRKPNDATPETTAKPNEEPSGGCSSVLGGGAILLILTAAGTAVLIHKKKED